MSLWGSLWYNGVMIIGALSHAYFRKGHKIKMKIVILDGITINPGDLSWHELESIGDVMVYDRTTDEELVSRIGDSEVIFTNKCKITGEVMDQCPNLKFIGVLATGYDPIDTKAAKERNIAVANVPAYSTESVAQHTFALILELCNNVGIHNEAVQEGAWGRSNDYCMVIKPIFQLTGKSLGIIGYGNIGKRVGEIARAFGMEVFPYSQEPEKAMKADIISVHCPATEENKGFINRDFISKMKNGAYLINTARGALIDEVHLADALKSGKLAGAALDVVGKEPIEDDSVLLGVPNLLITAHMAFSSKEARAVVCSTAAANLRAFLAGEMLNRVE